MSIFIVGKLDTSKPAIDINNILELRPPRHLSIGVTNRAVRYKRWLMDRIENDPKTSLRYGQMIKFATDNGPVNLICRKADYAPAVVAEVYGLLGDASKVLAKLVDDIANDANLKDVNTVEMEQGN